MTNISKHPLDQKTQEQLFSQFIGVFKTTNEKLTSQLFSALFTESEKIMFVKRLAIILLLSESYSTYAISRTLHVSDSTVREIRKKYYDNQYDALIKITKNKSFDKDQFWKTVEVLLQAGLPPRGKGRWKWLYKE